ncbi:universal stress protein [Kribbella sp. NPDC050281]|uniref:universal stress protein n=1 Tax=Kribbella sp. NPDC050281 TaxID=3155515 RepID=UPI0033EB9105
MPRPATNSEPQGQGDRPCRQSPPPIIVGYDGSPASHDALHWATVAAVRATAPLRIVEAFELVVYSRPSPGRVVPLQALHTARERGLSALAEGIRLQRPGLTVESVLAGGSAAEALLAEAEHARLVVNSRLQSGSAHPFTPARRPRRRAS